MTFREIISRIQNDFNSVSKDTFIPRRYILSIFKSKAEFFIAQKLNDKSLFRETNLFKWINCVSLIEDDLIKCDKVELRRCQSLMKSKKPLPKLLWSRYGSSIIMITSIDGSKEYQVITQKDYLNITQRPNGNKFKGKYAIIYPDNYLYIPDSEIKAVNVLVYTLDEKADDSSDCTECSACESYYDKEVSVPVKLLDAIIGETIKEVSFRFQVPYDSNPQGDPNQKTQTIK